MRFSVLGAALGFLLTLLLVPAARPQTDCLDYGNYLHAAGSILLGFGDPGTVTIANGYAYIADGYSLRIADLVQDPLHPPVVGVCPDLDTRWRVAVRGRYAFVPGLSCPLRIIDVSDPAAPHVVGSAGSSRPSADVAVSGNLACAAEGDSGIQVFDVSRLAAPLLLSGLKVPGTARQVNIEAGFAYVACGAAGMQVIDLEDPRSPRLAASVPGEALGVAVADGFAYVTGGSAGLSVVDILDPARPRTAATIAGIYAASVSLAGRHAYTEGEGRISVVDVSDPRAPRLETTMICASIPGGAVPAFAGDLGYAEWAEVVPTLFKDAYLWVYAFADRPLAAPILGSAAIPRIAGPMTVADGLAYVATADGDLMITDVSDPGSPRITGRLHLPAAAGGLQVFGDHLYAAAGRTFYTIDISDPGRPRIAGQVDVPGDAHRLQFVNGYAYLADGNAGLQVIDVSEPSAPFIAGAIPGLTAASDVAVANGVAYVTFQETQLYTYGCLLVIDVSRPDAPAIVGDLCLSGGPDDAGAPGRVAVAGDHAYVTSASRSGSDLVVFDLSDPRSPREVGSTPGLNGPISVANGTVYSAARDLYIFEASDPTHPRTAGQVPLDGEVIGVCASGDRLYVAVEGSGLKIVPAFCRSAPASFTLREPAPRDSLDGGRPARLAWSSAAFRGGPLAYTLFWSRDPGFRAADSTVVGADTSFTFPPHTLVSGGDYYWRVMARGPSGEAWSLPATGWPFHVRPYSGGPGSPQRLSLRVAPNPAAGPAEIIFTLPSSGKALLRLFDPQGRAIAAETLEGLHAGTNRIPFNPRGVTGRGLASGCYFLRLDAPGGHATARWLLLRGLP